MALFGGIRKQKTDIDLTDSLSKIGDVSRPNEFDKLQQLVSSIKIDLNLQGQLQAKDDPSTQANINSLRAKASDINELVETAVNQQPGALAEPQLLAKLNLNESIYDLVERGVLDGDKESFQAEKTRCEQIRNEIEGRQSDTVGKETMNASMPPIEQIIEQQGVLERIENYNTKIFDEEGRFKAETPSTEESKKILGFQDSEPFGKAEALERLQLVAQELSRGTHEREAFAHDDFSFRPDFQEHLSKAAIKLGVGADVAQSVWAAPDEEETAKRFSQTPSDKVEGSEKPSPDGKKSKQDNAKDQDSSNEAGSKIQEGFFKILDSLKGQSEKLEQGVKNIFHRDAKDAKNSRVKDTVKSQRQPVSKSRGSSIMKLATNLGVSTVVGGAFTKGVLTVWNNVVLSKASADALPDIYGMRPYVLGGAFLGAFLATSLTIWGAGKVKKHLQDVKELKDGKKP